MLVFGVIVAYNTDTKRLASVFRTLVPQCSVVLADNSEDPICSAEIRACVAQFGGLYIAMGGNQGIGAAQNMAIAAAWKAGAEAVLLLDDDSTPAPDLVSVLAACRSPVLGERAVFCANALDAQGRDIGNARGHTGLMPRCRDMMSSGTFLRRDVFETVGSFDVGLFIDCVDFDWGWRAQRLGVSIYVCRETAITHRLGEGVAAGVRIPSPIRHYYQFRNILRLMTRGHTPWGWRAIQAIKLPIKLMLIAMLMPNPMMRIRYAIAGIHDALRGRSGKWTKPAASG